MLKDLKKIKFSKKYIASIPEENGVYIFFSGKKPLYVGKSVNLRNRVKSYKNINLSRKTFKMISETSHFSFIPVTSEIEALLLEAKLVKLLNTPYNIQLKDDKHPLYIRITNDKYPLVLTSRKINEKVSNLEYFGPFPSSTSVKKTLSIIRKIFPFSQHLPTKRACIYSQIGLCNPCPSEIEKLKTPIEYKRAKKEYDKNIKMVVKFLNGDIKFVQNSLKKDIKNYSKNEQFERASVTLKKLNAVQYITSPKTSVSFFLDNPNLLEDIKNEELKNLKLILSKYLIIKNLKRIECFDVAHLSGSFPTASMVTFINGVSEKKYYRHFKIRKGKINNDTKALTEVAKRRLNHIKDWGIPDLIIVDGGRGQVNSFSSVFNKINIPIIGLAKETDSIIIKNESKFISIKLKQCPALNLIQRLIDESHRFARRLHHKLINKELFKNA
ncbi:MAG: GIY-YIG nuclease family protein [Candidatus Delongbacteria bacterium]|nr:GIY-YIG nuclease family protein [Candidatus Delongbacteria bacterium]